MTWQEAIFNLKNCTCCFKQPLRVYRLVSVTLHHGDELISSGEELIDNYLLGFCFIP